VLSTCSHQVLDALLLWTDSLPHCTGLFVPARHAENVTNIGVDKICASAKWERGGSPCRTSSTCPGKQVRWIASRYATAHSLSPGHLSSVIFQLSLSPPPSVSHQARWGSMKKSAIHSRNRGLKHTYTKVQQPFWKAGNKVICKF
jgi:hypothetical protein